MRTQDIKIGDYYRLHISGHYGYAKAIEIMRPKPKFLQKTEIEKKIKKVVVKCEWMISKNDTLGYIKYFRPCDLIKCKPKPCLECNGVGRAPIGGYDDYETCHHCRGTENVT